MHLSNVVFKVEENHKTNGAHKGNAIWNSVGSGGSVWWMTFIAVDIRHEQYKHEPALSAHSDAQLSR